MLDSLRRGASSWIAKALMILLVLSFAVWGIADVFRNGGADWVARVGSTRITAREFDASWRRELDGYQRQLGQPLTKERAVALGLPNRIVSRLITDTVVEEQARKLGLGVSDDETNRIIAEEKSFQGPDGKFDPERARLVLQQNGWTPVDFFRVKKREVLRRQLIDATAAPLPAPLALQQFADQYLNETRKVAVFTLGDAAAGTLPDPTPEEIAKFFDERKASFRSQEIRTFAYATMAPTDLVKPADIPDADAKAFYTSNPSNYGAPEMRRIEQLPFDTLDEAKAAADEIRGGRSFDDLLAARNLKPADADLGLMPRAGYLDQEVGRIAFDLAEGAVSGAIEGKIKPVIIRLVEVKAASLKPFEEAAADIKTQMARSKGITQMRDIRDQIEDARASGAKLDDIAKRFGLKPPVAAAIDAAGNDRDGKPLALPELAKIARAVFAVEPGVEADPVALPDNTLMLMDVTAVEPAKDRTLDEVRDTVIARFKDEQIRQALAKLGDDLVARIGKGEAIEEVAKSVGSEVRTLEGIKRGRPVEGLPDAAVSLAFSGPEGMAATVATSDRSRIVLKVVDATTPMFLPGGQEGEALAQQLAGDLQNSSVDQMVRQLRSESGVLLNQGLINQVIGVNSGG